MGCKCMQPQCLGNSDFHALCLKEQTSHPHSKLSGWKNNPGEVHYISPIARYCSFVCSLTHQENSLQIISSSWGLCHQLLPQRLPTFPTAFQTRKVESASTLLPYGQWITEKCNCIFCISPKPVPLSSSCFSQGPCHLSHRSPEQGGSAAGTSLCGMPTAGILSVHIVVTALSPQASDPSTIQQRKG